MPSDFESGMDRSNPDNNVILTKTESLTMGKPSAPKYARNKNILVIGGSGSGKTRFFVKPNLMQMHSSYVVTDPKGTVLIECGKMLRQGRPKRVNGKIVYRKDINGNYIKGKDGKYIPVYEPYKIKVFNTIDFSKSMHYNPFAYISEKNREKDILKFVEVLIKNTTSSQQPSGDDFWVKAEKLLYTAYIAMIFTMSPVEERNFETLIEMINASECREDDEEFKNAIDQQFEFLEHWLDNDFPDDYELSDSYNKIKKFRPSEEQRRIGAFALKQFKAYKLAAGKTAKSILISCSTRLAPFAIDEVLEITSFDELHLDKLGDELSALFIIISDTDATFNFLVAIMYSQLFNLLCTKADNSPGGKLNYHVRCLLDEFANIGEIPQFEKLIATIRSREISASIILQAKSQLKAIYKDIIERKFQEYERVIKELRYEISSRASMDVQSERDLYKQNNEALNVKLAELQRKNDTLQVRNQDLENLEITNQVLTNKNDELQSLVQELQDSIENYKQRIERLSASEARLSNRETRIAEIKKGYLPELYGAGLPMELSETQWLQSIYNQCNNYGITFPRRILYAFHTALKISDWSSITVLAGVSGTGKSELPKLYAAFGGLNFINVPVQPSWDSQESMLGFFNSIDNHFEPEPLLRFLVQCTEDPEYSKYMSIVLLDEMNLAHVEHYFADFLSKLETRRGTANVPTIEVKLGAGVDPYQLKLERTLLWTGTMNQDETTKSLSDKVLDRGLVINFPRPRILISRNGMKNLDAILKKLNRPMLTHEVWHNWIKKKIDLEGEQAAELMKYKAIVEEINNALELVGRALGHRVWQSIEHYIVNYPTVSEEIAKSVNGEMSESLRENMKIAFEDQIVQKIMPKLRGVETRGKSKECLDKIESLLEDNGFERLKDDFDIACEQGYGQFIWSSAKYIEADEEISNSELDEKQDKTDDTVDSENNSLNETEYTTTTAKDDE